MTAEEPPPPTRTQPSPAFVAACVGALVLAASGAAAAVVALGPGAGADVGPVRAAIPAADRSFEVDWRDVLAGDCFIPEQEGSYTVEVVPCEARHGAEVFLADLLPDGPWAGEAEIWETAWSRCIPAFEDFAEVPYEEPNTSLWPTPPTEEAWELGDRMLACVILPGYDVTGSLRGRGAELEAPPADEPEVTQEETHAEVPAETAGSRADDDLVVDKDPWTITLKTCYLVEGLPDEVSSLPVVPCESAHGGEVYAKRYLAPEDVPGGEHPGAAAMDGLAREICAEELEKFTGARAEDSRYAVWFTAPDEFALDWRAQSPEVVCFLESTADDLTGSARGTEE